MNNWRTRGLWWSFGASCGASTVAAWALMLGGGSRWTRWLR